MAETPADIEPLSLAFLGPVQSIHLRRWVGFMAGRGHRVTLLVAEGREIDPGLPASVAIERFTPLIAAGMRPTAIFSSRASLRRVLERVRPDVLNAHFLTHGYHAWLSGFHPYAVTTWGSDILVQPRESRLAAVAGRITLRAADLVMVNSEQVRQGALALGARRDRLEMVQWGVDLNSFKPGPDPAALRARLGLSGRRVVYSPRLIRPIYRQQVVVEALSSLPEDVSVLMTEWQADPEEVSAVRSKAESLGVGKRLVIVPGIEPDELPDFFRLADAVVSVPASDSTSSAIMEALASGKEVVACDLAGVRDWLGQLDPDALVPVDDPLATAGALRRALDRPPAERAAIGSKGRALVTERADASRTLARVESLFRRLAISKPARARV